MPITDRDYYRGKHPAACTCAECDRRRLGNQGRETQGREEQAPTMYCAKHRRTPTNVRCGSCDTPICPDCLVFGPLGQRCRDGCRNPKPYRRPSVEQPAQTTAPATPAPRSVRRRSGEQTRAISRRTKRRGFWGWTKWPVAGLLVLAMLATVAAMGYHGGSLPSAFTMTTDDYRLLAACPTEVEAFWEFFRRPAQEDYVPMSERYGDSWTDQICNASASQQQSMPTPDTQAMVQAAIAATVQAVTATDATLTPSPTPDTQATVQAAIAATVQAVTAADTTSPPSPTPEPVSAVLPTATPTPTSTPLPMATPTPDAVATYDELRLFALSLINDDRRAHGLPDVVLGLNPAAQMHANDMIAHDYFGHWWQDGRKPYMVYSETGGASYVSENVATSGWTSRRWAERNCDSFLVNCIVPEVREAIKDAQWGMMYDDAHADWGHRDTILGVSHRAVNLGIAANGRRVVYVQHFEGGDVAADARPSISVNGVLSLSVSKIAGGVDIAEQVTIYYDPPPTPKTPEQIDLMDSYCTGGGFSTQCGEPVAAVLRPLGGGSYYVGLERTDVVANGWSETSDKFSFSASMGSLLDAPGVYTVVVWRDSADGWLSEGLVELSFVKQ